MPINRIDLHNTIADLSFLVNEMHREELQGDLAVLFVLKALIVIEQRVTACAEREVRSTGVRESVSGSGRKRRGSGLKDMTDNTVITINEATSESSNGGGVGGVGLDTSVRRAVGVGGSSAAVTLVAQDCCCSCGGHQGAGGGQSAGSLLASSAHRRLSQLSPTMGGLFGDGSSGGLQMQDLFFNKLLSVGHVISVHCGHNGWLSEDEVNLVADFLDLNH